MNFYQKYIENVKMPWYNHEYRFCGPITKLSVIIKEER